MTLIGVLLAGAVAGFVLGFAGAGGTIVGIPFYLYIADVAPHQTLGTNALGVAAIGIFLLVVRGLRDELRYGPGIAFAIPGLIGVYFGTRASTYVSGSRLVFFLGFVVLIVAAYIFYLSTRDVTHSPGAAVRSSAQEPGVLPDEPATGSRTLQVAVPARLADVDDSVPANRQFGPIALRTGSLGLAVGAVAGFFGIGGGFMIVPGTSWAAKIDLKVAAAASLIPITAFAAFVGGRYAVAGSTSFPHAGIMALTGIVFGSFGIWLSTKVPTTPFQRVFAGLLVLVGIYMIIFH
ncbi:MAG: sulfite exporter TauE/SafE family protein [Acidimicrobiales bacterium]